MSEIAFISEFPLRRSGGGTFAVNWHAFHQLKKHFRVTSVQTIAQHSDFWPLFLSRIQRKVLHKRASFVFFSKKRLRENAANISRCLAPNHEVALFKGATPWVGWKADRPYFAYLDICFHTFFQNTFAESDFHSDDLCRIYDAEAAWLENAGGVFWESRWGLEMARKAYGLGGKRWVAAGRGGNVEPPKADIWNNQSLSLVTIANRFRQKGGDVVLEAFRQLKMKYPQLTWHIIGGAPEGDWQSMAGITYEGFLHSDNPVQSARFRYIMEQAFLLIHPTREDANPLVLTEAAYFGCPSVSVRRFAIPELIADGKTGLLVEFPAKADQVASAIEQLVCDKQAYRSMRTAARSDALARFQWDGIGTRMAESIKVCIGSKKGAGSTI